jgi:hypothetical protein
MRQIGRRGQSDASAFEPEDDGGEDEHGAVVERTFLVARRQATPLFESIDAALDHVAPCVDRGIEEERSPWPSCSLRALVASLGNRVLDLPLAQQAPTAAIAVALVGDEVIWAGAWSPAPSHAWDTDAIQDRLQLGTVMTMSWGNDDGERPPAAVTGEMKLGRQPSTAASESFVGRVGDLFFSSARLRRRRAPLAC